MRHNNSILAAPLVTELIQQRQRLRVQFQTCQETLAALAAAPNQGSDDERIARWDAILALKTQQITLSSKIELINELLELGEQAVSDLPQTPQHHS